MVNYDLAVGGADPAARAEARQWILEYNEDDVRATAALRDGWTGRRDAAVDRGRRSWRREQDEVCGGRGASEHQVL